MSEQGELLPKAEASMLQDLNNAKALAWEHAANAVMVLVSVMNDADSDLDQRIQAAAELLQFCAKGPF